MKPNYSSNRLTRKISLPVLALLATGALACPVLADDAPQFRGPNRDGIYKEKGLLQSWGAGGPKLLWKSPRRGEGHATPSVANGRVYGMGLRDNQEIVWAVDVKTGDEVWSTPIAPGISLDAGQGGYGSRSTPTVVGKKLYTLGVGGELVCLNVADGKLLWHKNLVKDFGGSIPTWGYCESPLVDGEKVIIAPGGENTIIALNRNTGDTLWTTRVPEKDRAHYSSAIATEVDGVRQYVEFLGGGLIGVSAKDGKFLWRYNTPANGTANCAAPIAIENLIFAASGYGTGGGLAQLASNGGGISAKQIYFTKEMQNHHGGMVVVGDYLYGFNGGTLTCLEFKTGKVMWTDRSVGKGSVTFADGRLYVRSERGPIALVEATPKGYVEAGRFDQPDRSNQPSWPYIVVSNGKMYVRDMNNLLCYDVK
ncbi:polyvinylalcohol dehydrogenase [Armatimonadota bacterium]|nr:polyvinylalcohol dehydrogenase [Armatimonadota bacterium]